MPVKEGRWRQEVVSVCVCGGGVIDKLFFSVNVTDPEYMKRLEQQ